MIAIIGSGIAGLTAAISLIKRGFDVVVYTPDVFKSNSYLAQAGIALPLANGDSPLNHVLDTLKSGKGLSNIETVWNVISKATEAYDFLTSLGLEFDYISKEGGHSTARVFSIRGETGKWITTRLIEVCKEYGIDIINKSVEGLAIGGRECYGVIVNGELIRSDAVVLASGGYSALYKYFSGVDSAIGVLIGDAIIKGAIASSLEFIQFHPTAFIGKNRVILISESLRGFGAKIIDSNGKRFVNELATRDIVSREIFRRIISGERVFLDLRGINNIEEISPFVYNSLVEEGIDPKEDPVPIMPVAHYTIGGLFTDLYYRTTIRRLYAIGESAENGFHGANRLASNSLLECVVSGIEVARTIARDQPKSPRSPVNLKVFEGSLDSIGDLREILWNSVGIIREERDLKEALKKVEMLEIDPRIKILVIGIIKSAILRRESRGTHYRVDYPTINHKLSKRIIYDGRVVRFIGDQHVA